MTGQTNAVMGISRPGDGFFDVIHFNLHKTFHASAAAVPARAYRMQGISKEFLPSR